MSRFAQPSGHPSPLFFIGHDGVDTSPLADLPGLFLRDGRDRMIAALSAACHQLEETGPLAGLRAAGQPTTPAQPWFGAERTDPERLRARLASLIHAHVIDPPPGTRRPALLSRQIFWTWEECRAATELMMQSHAEARLVLLCPETKPASALFSERRDWSVDAAHRAIATMQSYAKPLRKQFGARCLIWQMPGHVATPDAGLRQTLMAES